METGVKPAVFESRVAPPGRGPGAPAERSPSLEDLLGAPAMVRRRSSTRPAVSPNSPPRLLSKNPTDAGSNAPIGHH